MDNPTRPRHEENHPLPWDGVVKESEGEGDLSSCAAKMGDGAMGVGVSGIVEWNSSSPLAVAAVFTAVLGREREREGLIYAHFNMTANTSSPVSSLSGAPARRERKKERRG